MIPRCPLPIVCAAALLAGTLMSLGCAAAAHTDDADEDPVVFSHARHLRYFLGGAHKTENVKRHLDGLGMADAPPEILEGRCLECHASFDEVPACAGCHSVFQHEAVRNNPAERPCLGCHRSAWTGYQATIPTVAVCSSCHGEAPRTTSEQEKVLRAYISEGQDIPWIQGRRFADNVLFSHVAHVRFGAQGCASCHARAPDERATPLVPVLSMTDCITCHERQQAETSCLACHK